MDDPILPWRVEVGVEAYGRGSRPISARAFLSRLRIRGPRLRRVCDSQGGSQPLDARLSGPSGGPGGRIRNLGPQTVPSSQRSARPLLFDCTPPVAPRRRRGSGTGRGIGADGTRSIAKLATLGQPVNGLDPGA